MYSTLLCTFYFVYILLYYVHFTLLCTFYFIMYILLYCVHSTLVCIAMIFIDSDNIHEDLAELTCEISIKQKLVEELEQTQKRLHSVRVQYEEKVVQLQVKIKSIEMERDTILSNIGKAFIYSPNSQR